MTRAPYIVEAVTTTGRRLEGEGETLLEAYQNTLGQIAQHEVTHDPHACSWLDCERCAREKDDV